MGKEPRLRSLLAIGGLDPAGGAGVLVDGGAARSLGLHAAAVVALVTVQDGRSFAGAAAVDPGLVRGGIEAVLRSQDVGAVKTGALGTARIVGAIADLAARDGFPPLVVDPVVASTSGGELLDRDGVRLLREELMPLATLFTPNAVEAAALSGVEVRDAEGAARAGERLVGMGARAVLVKGGHLSGERVVDVLVRPGKAVLSFEGTRIRPADVRGTGCALASLVAGHLALGRDLPEAVGAAREALREAVSRARPAGSGPPFLRFE